MKHILFISDNFYPESNALANRLYDHARIWVKEGYQVTILTCVPNFPKGKVFQGYKNKWRSKEVVDGIEVIRIKSFIAQNKGSFKRIVDYLSFGMHASIQGLFIKKVDLVIGTSPQPFSVFAAWFVARLKRKAFIFELRDLWPESVVAVDAMGKQNLLLRLFGWSVKRLYKKADMIVSVTDSFKNILIQQDGIDPEKIIVCKNGIDFSQIKPPLDVQSLKLQYQIGEKFLVGYIGTIGMAHSVHTIIEAAKLTEDQSVHFIIMGTGAYAEQIKSQAQTLDNVTFIDSGSRFDAIEVTNMLDASIVHLKNTPLFETVIPSKVFESMALGKPILMGVKGEVRDIVINQAQAGIAFEPEDAVSLNQAIAQMKVEEFDHKRIKDFVAMYFDRNQIAIRMLDEIKLKLLKA
ncbi:MAG: glycosyltransferase WbuB [Gammaproteobacteria bacterium]|nr:MAG: glycosyltransferase WbuB [Gammaproteobacteria bacterium]UTW42483.1 glycosyltransferase family 4 protein [bacterium SCSIO 12844]